MRERKNGIQQLIGTRGSHIIIIIISNIKNNEDVVTADLPGGEPETTEFQTQNQTSARARSLTYTAHDYTWPTTLQPTKLKTHPLSGSVGDEIRLEIKTLETLTFCRHGGRLLLLVSMFSYAGVCDRTIDVVIGVIKCCI